MKKSLFSDINAGCILIMAGLFVVLKAMVCFAGNPIMIPSQGVCDPHIKIFDNTAYLYATHDYSIDSTSFVMKDWWVWSSTDLVNWTYRCTLKPEDTYIGPSNSCWAGDCEEKNGQYYWYVSVDPTNIAVFKSTSPTGPWEDPLGQHFIPSTLTPVAERDPAVFTDTNGDSYIIFGVWDYYIAKLNNDMVSLAETPVKVIIYNPQGPYGEGTTDDKPDIHKYGNTYYLTWSSFYAMSSSIYGPYDCKGTIINSANVAPEFRDCDLTHDRHGKFFEWGGQWYFGCNDKCQPGAHEHFRNTIITPVYYKANGEIEPIIIDRAGAIYPPGIATSRVYEAEDGILSKGAKKGFFKRLFSGGKLVVNDFAASGYKTVDNMKSPGSAITLNSVDGGEGGSATLKVNYASSSSKAVKLSLYVNGTDVEQLMFSNTGGWNMDNPGEKLTTINLNEGTGNTIKLQIDPDDKPTSGISIDNFIVILSKGKQDG